MSWAERTGRLALAVACVGVVAACGTGNATVAENDAPAHRGTAADATTRGLAEVEFARQCAAGTVNFADEADFDTDLDGRLSAAGFTHAQWKTWHDALADSPGLVDQYAEVAAGGCPAS